MPTSTHTNKLINEKSPYLLQHAHNPVDWFPWGDEAFKKAKSEDKPVFLSIGYSTCHWCHVMERESFEDEQVAEVMNRSFISIKVDREERPDVDNFYMSACMALGGSGGWPLSCFLLPDKRPFFAGTYFPKEDGYGLPGFISVLDGISALWRNDRDQLAAASSSVLEHISWAGKSAPLRDDAEKDAFQALLSNYDEENGGFGGAPKFPSVQNLLFLMRYGLAHNEKKAVEMVRKALDGMRSGGIYDQIGGGFCRYSTDEQWLVPHFEKMLYDNALHIIAYSEASVLLDAGYAQTARDTTEFVLRELHDASGGFFTALDADSEGEEGKYYLFTPHEIESVLGSAAGERYCELYDITLGGNFERRNIPNLLGTKPTEDDRAFARGANASLLEYRARRVPPQRDDKILASGNGLMIAALAVEGRMLGEQEFIGIAESCASFTMEKLFLRGRLQARWRAGEAGIPAGCSDYAYLIWGLIELYEATFKPHWLEQALKLARDMESLFWDELDGGFYLSGSDVGDLPLRQKDFYDGAVPSGNSVAALNLLRLARLTGDPALEKRMNALVNAAASIVNRNPSAYCGLLCALLYAKAQGSEVILAQGEGFDALKACLPRFAPFTAAAVCGGSCENVKELAPFWGGFKPQGGRAAAYVCRGGACMQPVTEPSALKKLLEHPTVVF